MTLPLRCVYDSDYTMYDFCVNDYIGDSFLRFNWCLKIVQTNNTEKEFCVRDKQGC